MTPLPGFADKFMPKQFVETGYYDTALIGDATEVLISQSENYDLNNLTFSIVTRTIQPERYVHVWTMPCGFLLHCTEAYPGSISDSDITDQSRVLHSVTKLL